MKRQRRVDIIKLKEAINKNLEYLKKDYRVEFLIPLTESWAYYKDNDTTSEQEWLVHLTCPSRTKLKHLSNYSNNADRTLYCWTDSKNRRCTGCDSLPSKASVNKKEILSKITKYVA